MEPHGEFPVYKENRGKSFLQSTIPLPPRDGFPMAIRTYDDVPEEPRFDPAIHLDLHMPRFIRMLPHFEKSFQLPEASDEQGSSLAWSSPFQVNIILKIQNQKFHTTKKTKFK